MELMHCRGTRLTPSPTQAGLENTALHLSHSVVQDTVQNPNLMD